MSKIIHDINREKTSGKTIDKFSDFFRNASKEEKNSIFTKAAKKANKDQRDLIKRANLKLENA